jgi:hypothetical protein
MSASAIHRPQATCPSCGEQRFTWQPADRIGPVMTWHDRTTADGTAREHCDGTCKPPKMATPHRPERAA